MDCALNRSVSVPTKENSNNISAKIEHEEIKHS